MVMVRSCNILEWIAGGNCGLQLRQFSFDAVDRVDDVGAGLAVDRDQNRRVAVGVAGCGHLRPNR